MRKIFTFLLSVLFVSTISAQHPEAVLQKATTLPVVGGDIDAVWDDVDANVIDKGFQAETPTLGQDGQTWWKGMWSDDGIYILVNVTDNSYYPFYQYRDEHATGGTNYLYDMIELYFACNYVNNGGTSRPTSTNGNWQIAPQITKGMDNGTEMSNYGDNSSSPGATDLRYAYNADDDPNWFSEWFIPFTYLRDENGAQVDISGNIGFDVTIIDGDHGVDEHRDRAVWSNTGDINESWANVTDVGTITLDGAEVIYVDAITLTGGAITMDNQTLQIQADIEPVDATDKSLKWIIDPASTARAKLSADGVVTPYTNGDFIVTATSSDGFVYSNTITIPISGQIATVGEMSWIVDGYNQAPNEDGTPNDAWARGDGINDHTAYVLDGVFYFSPDTVLDNAYSMKIRQRVNLPLDYADKKFLVGFRMWANEDCSFDLVCEDGGNGWVGWGDHADAETSNMAPSATQVVGL
jgi:hypothetical protein